MDASVYQPILDRAERAASSGDYALAESLLREAAGLQAASLGLQHPDLASTFNNLGVVCEKANKLADARQFYRQALSIASASLDSENPLVITSRNNFNDFCRAHGTVDAAASQSIDAATAVQEADLHQTAIETVNTGPRLGTVAGVVMAIALLGALAMWFARTPVSPSGTAGERSSARGQQDVVSSVLSPEPNPSRPTAVDTPVGRQVAPTGDAPAKNLLPTSTEEVARVIESSFCQSLSTTGRQWECIGSGAAAGGGPLYFYTRIASPRSIRVHHRWYRNGRVWQDVDLDVQANPSAGYRTYSRQRVDPGQWRVEVVAGSGEVLQEERITIR